MVEQLDPIRPLNLGQTLYHGETSTILDNLETLVLFPAETKLDWAGPNLFTTAGIMPGIMGSHKNYQSLLVPKDP